MAGGAEMSDALRERTGLPPALRVLAETLPRDGWEGHPNFTAHTRFWLDRHLMFRDVLDRLRSGTESYLGGGMDPLDHARTTARYAQFLLGELHTHHHIEDDHYFPLLIGLDKRLEGGFALLDRDHRALEEEIDATAQAVNTLLRAEPHDMRDAAGPMQAQFAAFERFIDRHLEDEEDLVVPVILTYAPRLG